MRRLLESEETVVLNGLTNSSLSREIARDEKRRELGWLSISTVHEILGVGEPCVLIHVSVKDHKDLKEVLWEEKDVYAVEPGEDMSSEKFAADCIQRAEWIYSRKMARPSRRPSGSTPMPSP